MKVNADVINTLNADLASQFILKAKPTYARIESAILKPLEDAVSIDDVMSFSYGSPPVFYDSIGAGLPMAVKFDEGTVREGLFEFNGGMHTLYFWGSDLITVQQSGQVQLTTSSGGLIDARTSLGENHDSPYIRPGDLLSINSGNNEGRFVILSVDSDTQLTVETEGQTFEALQDQEFTIYRRMQNPIWVGTADAVHNTPTLMASSGWFSGGVGVGDEVVLFHPVSKDAVWRYIITATNAFTNEFTINKSFAGSSDTYSAVVIRDALSTKYLLANKEDTPFTASFTDQSPFVTFDGQFSDLAQLGMIKPGDTLIKTITSEPFEILAFHGASLTARLVLLPQALPAISLLKYGEKIESETPVSADILDRIPDDYLRLELTANIHDLRTTVGSSRVSTASGVN